MEQSDCSGVNWVICQGEWILEVHFNFKIFLNKKLNLTILFKF